jgi:hypothetical protein
LLYWFYSLKYVTMSTEQDKFKHSKRLLKDENAVKKQTRIAKEYGFPVENSHRFAKMHSTNCGDPGCHMCGNPRKFFKEPTVQEKRFNQDMETHRDKRSNGTLPKDEE